MDFAGFLNLIDASFIYDGGKKMATFIVTAITPILLIVAIWIRLAQCQLETVTNGSGKWGVFLKDLALWTIVLGLYFTLAGMLSDLFNVLYDYFQKQGSAAAIQEEFMSMIDQIENRSDDDRSLFDRTFDVMGNAVTFTVWLIYYFSFILATFLVQFLKMAHALAWSFALVWGLIAIPMSLVSSFKLLKGWAIFSGVVLCWPLFHFGGFALFNPIFEAAAKTFVEGDGAGMASMDQAQLYLIMTFVNLISVAVALAAPFVAQAFISNSGSVAGVVAPFALAATGMAGAGVMAAKSRLQGAGRAAGDSARSLKDTFMPDKKTPSSGGGGSQFSPNSGGSSPSLGPSANAGGNTESSTNLNNQTSTEHTKSHQDTASHQDTSTSTTKGDAHGREQASPVKAQLDSPAVAAPSKSSMAHTAASAATFSGSSTDSLAAVSDEKAVEAVTEQHGKSQSGKAKQAKRGAFLDQAHKKGQIKLKGRDK